MSHYHCQYHIGIVVIGIIQLCFMNMQGGAYIGGAWVPMTLLGSGKKCSKSAISRKSTRAFQFRDLLPYIIIGFQIGTVLIAQTQKHEFISDSSYGDPPPPVRKPGYTPDMKVEVQLAL